ncbi:MAG TPA: sulfotransferase [Sphingobium sp.]|nr:sulfotransferase [Sphingobium sp.]
MREIIPHVILTLGRSGSNTLVDLLNQSDEILNYGEVLGSWNKIRRFRRLIAGNSGGEARYVDRLLHDRSVAAAANLARTAGKIRRGAFGDIKRLRTIRTIGFKEFSLNIRNMGLADHLLGQTDIRFIGLVRRNPLERLVSWRRMAATGEVAARTARKAAPVALTLDPATIVDDLEIIQREVDELDALLARIPSERRRVIEYDDLYARPDTTIRIARDLYDFLGVTRMNPRVRMKKIIQRPMAQVIANYEDCRRAAANSRFAPCFS